VTKGSGVVQPAAGAGTGAGVATAPDGIGMPGGNHPPLKQNHPGPGETVVHPVSAGVEGTLGGGAGEDAGGDAPTGIAMPGGSHPPLKQVQPGPG
jgi:hypothetical protein